MQYIHDEIKSMRFGLFLGSLGTNHVLAVAVAASALIFGSLDVIEHALSKPKKGGKRMIVSRGERMQRKKATHTGPTTLPPAA